MAWQWGLPAFAVMPRVKTYSASSGFVYQYQFTGHEAGPDGDHYRFATTQDRRSVFDVVVFLPKTTLGDWETREGRTLTPTERYAVAKMALFAAYDEAQEPKDLPNPIAVDTSEVRAIAEMLDL